jgi:hypothetical protein
MNQGGPPPWPEQPPYAGPPGGPYAAPPGGPYRGPYGVQRPLGSRIQSLGTLCLILAILELLYSAVRIASSVLSSAAIDLQRSAMRAMPPEATQGMAAMQDVAQSFARRVMIWETVRTLPFVVATVFLLLIALRLRKGDATALRAARTWMFGALGAVGVSLLIQLLVTMPLSAELQRQMLGAMHTPDGKGPPIDPNALAGITEVFTLATMAFGAALLSTWPVVLYVWAGKLQKEAQAFGEPRASL